jgi:transcriptional regulator with XRE-family HTH domain
MKSPTKLISMPKVAARLRLTRQALKLSQAGLCRIARISPEAWNNAETGDNLIGIGNAINAQPVSRWIGFIEASAQTCLR